MRLVYNPMNGFQITSADLTSRTTGYEKSFSHSHVNNAGLIEVRIILYSPYGAAIIPGDGDILRIHYRTSADMFGENQLRFTPGILLTDLQVKPLSASSEAGRVAIYDEQTHINSLPIDVPVFSLSSSLDFTPDLLTINSFSDFPLDEIQHFHSYDSSTGTVPPEVISLFYTDLLIAPWLNTGKTPMLHRAFQLEVTDTLQTPEPGTMVLFILGLFGIFVVITHGSRRW